MTSLAKNFDDYDGEKLERAYNLLAIEFEGRRNFLKHSLKALGLLDRRTSSQALGSFKTLPPCK